ncbi:MAG: hypothetical protein U1D55_10550 [Phycisphaerae bacterium]
MDDPVTLALTASGTLIVFSILARVVMARRGAAAERRRLAERRSALGSMAMQQQEIERLAARIIATSSTKTIAGFSIVRQIEAVFVDGQPSPARAVEVLKAHAAAKGANAIINIAGERLPSGKCQAHGDAVIAKDTSASRHGT